MFKFWIQLFGFFGYSVFSHHQQRRTFFLPVNNHATIRLLSGFTQGNASTTRRT